MIFNPMKYIRFAKKVLRGWRKTLNENHISVIKQFKEIYSLLKLNRMEPEEYYEYKLYNPELSWDDKKSYLTRSQYYLIESAVNPRAEVGILNKFAFHQYARQFDLPTPEMYGLFEPNMGFSADGSDLKTSNDLKALLTHPGVSDFVIKPTSTGKGVGVMVCKLNDDKTVHIFGEGDFSFDDLHKRLSQSHCTGRANASDIFIIEKRVKQHKFLDNYSKLCTQGLRIAVFFTSRGNVQILYTILKIASKDKYVDNVGSTGMNATVSEEGMLGPGKQLVPDGVIVHEKHPVTGHPIAGEKMPYFAEAKALVVKAQSLLPFVRMVGWDVAITDDGPLLFEGNYGSPFYARQLTFDKGILRGEFAKEVYALMKKKKCNI